MLKLKEIQIKQDNWLDGKLTGKATFSGMSYDVSFEIDEKTCRSIIDLCADRLIDASNEIAMSMKGKK